MAVDMGLYVLPEEFIADALSLTSPRDACMLSLVASKFSSVAQSDAVWERFLPTDYRDILGRSKGGVELLRSFASKKELYLYLCDHPILIDDDTKTFSLDKWSGKKCYMLAAKDLHIVWGDTPIYWQWISLPESRFPTVAELLNVCWFEIRGKIKTSILSPNTTYSAYLVFTADLETYCFGDQPAEASVAITGQESHTRAVYLDTVAAQRHRQRGDGWMEVELGEYFVEEGQDVELDMRFMEVKDGNSKHGLIVEGIELRPKGEK